MRSIGFMQGRLSDQVDGKIQSFPWNSWKKEFELAYQNCYGLMEWTLDQENIKINPLMTSSGRQEILDLCNKFSVSIPSLTGDCFMQAPFWGAEGEMVNRLQDLFLEVVEASAKVGIKIIVVPLVDNGSIDSLAKEACLKNFFEINEAYFLERKIKIAFESDYPPKKLASFMASFNPEFIGLNYDIGNSASLGYEPIEEFDSYFKRIINIHIKDREFGGTTVPLGSGAANFRKIFNLTQTRGYKGNFILQTARASDGDHVKTLNTYRSYALQQMEAL